VAEPFLAEIRLFSFNFAPKGWALCNGQLLPINQNQALFSLLGTTYGGDGRVNFALPNLQGRVALHTGNGHTLGERAGETGHALNVNEIPAHTHAMNASPSTGNNVIPTGNVLASSLNQSYRALDGPSTMQPNAVGNTGGSQAHANEQPYLVLNACIALQGIFPSQN
jgi:microcystin-dependent protein